ncbi:MAG: hypothetical protein GY723_22745, partial [bacterium]|nr:hypothetical protein [bacterium]
MNYSRTLKEASMLLIMLPCLMNAATFSGTVTDGNAPLEGAIVTLIDGQQNKKVSVYTNANGHYDVDSDARGPIEIRARYFTFSDQVHAIDDPTQDTSIDFELVPASTEEVRQQLPANIWAERIARISPDIDREFRIECMMCHQQGNNLARWPTNREQWYTVFDRMAHKNAMVSDDTREQTIDALLAAYVLQGDDDLPRIPPMPRGKETTATVTEWGMEPGGIMHDIAVGPDGLIYGAGTKDNQIWRLDPKTSERQEMTHVKPEGNSFVGDALGLHTVLPGPDGTSMWFTYAQGNVLSRYDIPSDTMKVWNLSYFDGIYPHTLRFDDDGQVWFTVTLTNQLGTVNPETDELEVINLPTRNWMQSLYAWPPAAAIVAQIQRNSSYSFVFDRELRPIAYGIDVTPDGKVWFSQYNNRRIGYYDKHSKEIEMVDTPFGGPRRFRADSQGNLWIPAFTDGRIYKYEPVADKFTGYDLPTGSGDSVYAIGVDPIDDTVWGCGSNSDTMLHFDPKTEGFTTYRLPS